MRILFVLLVIAGFSAGMFFLFTEVLGLDVLGNDPVDIGDFDAIVLVGIFIALYLFQSVTLNLIPGTTTFFISVLAYSLFGDFIVIFVVSIVAVLLSSFVLYFLGRFGGRRLLYWLFKKESLDHRLEWFSRNGVKGVPWLFLVPLFPTDLLCLTCGVAKMKFWHFLLIVIVFRPIEIALLLSYPFIFNSEIVQSLQVWERVIILNVLVLNVAMLILYYKTLLRLFQRPEPRR